MLSVPRKIYEHISVERLKIQIEHQLEEEQYGFRKGRSRIDLIFFKKLIEKSIEFGKRLCLFYRHDKGIR